MIEWERVVYRKKIKSCNRLEEGSQGTINVLTVPTLCADRSESAITMLARSTENLDGGCDELKEDDVSTENLGAKVMEVPFSESWYFPLKPLVRARIPKGQ
jgi:hypothetical protein